MLFYRILYENFFPIRRQFTDVHFSNFFFFSLALIQYLMPVTQSIVETCYGSAFEEIPEIHFYVNYDSVLMN